MRSQDGTMHYGKQLVKLITPSCSQSHRLPWTLISIWLSQVMRV